MTRTLTRCLALALGLCLAPSIAMAAEITHVVAKGQTLGRIAKRYHTTVEVLREVNDLKRGERLKPGFVLVIPEKGKEKQAAERAQALRAKKADDRAHKAGREPPAKERARDKAATKEAADDRVEARECRRGVCSPSDLARRPKRPGFLRMVRGTDNLDTQLLTRGGRLVPGALAGVSRMLRFGPSGATIAIDPRLATLVGMVSDHFGGRPLHVVSGFRPYSPTQYTPHSNHNVGRAIDFTIEGVPNTMLRDFCRTFRSAGVGYYPNSTFVHLDVRPMKAYWIDYSRPGEAPRYDTPAAGLAADEAPAEALRGSSETLPSQGEPLDPKEGNQDPADQHPASSPGMGGSAPTPP